MKTGKLVTIDVEIAEKLKGINASRLINGLLIEYFDLKQGKNTVIEEKKAVLNAIKIKKNISLKILRSLRHGIASIWTDIPGFGSKQEKEIMTDKKSGIISSHGG